MPAVSVVTLFHRVTPFLRPAVQSVLQQTFADLELLLVDNGTGQGLAPLGEFGHDPRIRLIARPTNAGIAAGHNAAIAEARGEFVALLDHDDIALPQRLERQIALLRSEPRLSLVSSAAQTIDAGGVVIGREFALMNEGEQLAFTAYSMPAPTPSFTGRTEIFRRFPYSDRFPYAGDYDFVARAAEVAPTRGVPEVLMQYRSHAEQTTRQHHAGQILSACTIRLLTARRRAGQPENFDATIAKVEAWAKPGRTVVEIYRHFAESSWAESFPLLAVYHARKVLSVRRNVTDMAWAFGLLARAWRRERGLRGRLVRMFFGGPLRAHGLKPA